MVAHLGGYSPLWGGVTSTCPVVSVHLGGSHTVSCTTSRVLAGSPSLSEAPVTPRTPAPLGGSDEAWGSRGSGLARHGRRWQGWDRPPCSQTFQGAASPSSAMQEHVCAERRTMGCPRRGGGLALGRVGWQASCSRNEGCVPTVTIKHSNSFKLLVQSRRVHGKQTNTGLRASWHLVAAKGNDATGSAGDASAAGGQRVGAAA